MLNDTQIENITSNKIFFGHQSVGNNLVKGIQDLAEADPRLKLKIMKSADPQSVSGPAFIEFEVGQNGSPQSKIDGFAAILDKGMGAQGGIAMFKFCYVDIELSTDIIRMAAAYEHAINALKHKYPRLTIVHVTIPLTGREPTMKRWAKWLLGKTTRIQLNAKRNQFNDIIRQTYGGTDPIFDLADVESTHLDGSRSYVNRGNESIHMLAPEFTADGGHLNELGRRVAAERLLLTLAEIDTVSLVRPLASA